MWKTFNVLEIGKIYEHPRCLCEANRKLVCGKYTDICLEMCSRVGDTLRILKMSTPFMLSRGEEVWTHCTVFFDLLGPICPNIETIDVGIRCWPTAHDVDFEVFARLKVLKFVKFVPYGPLFGWKLLRIPATVEKFSSYNYDTPSFVEEAMQFLRTHPRLRSVKFRRLRSFRAPLEVFPTVVENCPKLEKLSLLSCRLSSKGIEQLSGLKTLNLNNSDELDIGEEQMATICARNPSLQTLKIVGCCKDFGRAGCETIASLENLRRLAIGANGSHMNGLQLDDDTLEMVVQRRSETLCSLELHGLPEITDRSLHLIGAVCEHFRYLYVYNCKQISPEGIMGLIDRVVVSPTWKDERDRLQIEIATFQHRLKLQPLANVQLPLGVELRLI